jgi:hypothetical protein
MIILFLLKMMLKMRRGLGCITSRVTTRSLGLYGSILSV